jgi:hypothetical protein
VVGEESPTSGSFKSMLRRSNKIGHEYQAQQVCKFILKPLGLLSSRERSGSSLVNFYLPEFSPFSEIGCFVFSFGGQ